MTEPETKHDPNEIRLKFRLSSADVSAAQEAMNRGKNFKQVITFIVVIGLVFLGILGVGLVKIYNIFKDGEIGKEQLLMVWNDPMAMMALIVAMLPFFYLFVVIAKKKAGKRFDENSPEITCIINSSQISFQDENGIATIPWKDFDDWEESTDFFLFYETSFRIRCLPKRFMSQLEVAKVREWLGAPSQEVAVNEIEQDPGDENAIQCTGKISFEEFASTKKDFYKVQRFIVMMLAILSLLLLSMGIVGRMFPEQIRKLNNGHPVGNGPQMQTKTWVISFMMFTVYFFGLGYFRKKEKESFEKDKLSWGEASYVITPEYFSCTTSHSKAKLYWKDFIRWSENKYVFLFIQEYGKPAVIFPKRLLDGDEQRQLKEWLTQSKEQKKVHHGNAYQ